MSRDSLAKALRTIAGSLILATASAGCATFGSDVIRAGRPAYNDAILATNDEQLLQNIVRIRFGDGIGFLTVASVTANVSMSVSGSANVGLGPASSFAGNLVPLAGGIATEQNPTISYVPVSGDRLLRQLAGELPLDLTLLSVQTAHAPLDAWHWLVRRVNDIRNPDFTGGASRDPDPRFEEVANLRAALGARGALYWARLDGPSGGIAFVLHGYSGADSANALRLLELLGVPKPERDGDDVVVPVVLAAGTPTPGTMEIETRSLHSMMRIAAARIELPDGARGALPFDPPGPAGRGIRIHSSDARPQAARVAVEYRGRWYYVDESDARTKQWFGVLGLLFSAQVPDSQASIAPMLTIPVSGRR